MGCPRTKPSGEASVTRKQVSQPNVFMFFLHQIQESRNFLVRDGQEDDHYYQFPQLHPGKKAWQGRESRCWGKAMVAIFDRVRDCARLKSLPSIICNYIHSKTSFSIGISRPHSRTILVGCKVHVG